MELFKKKMDISIQGNIDLITKTAMSGWFHIANRKESILVTLYKNDSLIASFKCDHYREDVKNAGFGNGYSGFSINLIEPLFEENSNKEIEDLFIEIEGKKFPLKKFISENTTIELAEKKEKEKIWFFFPDYTINNHYQKLFYKGFPKDIIIRSGAIGDALGHLVSYPEDEVTFHLHWVAPTQHSPNKSERKAFQIAFLKSIERFKKLGGKTVWTLHNLVSHDLNSEERKNEEISFRRKLALAFHKIHIHSESIFQTINDSYQIPKEKTIFSPHGSFSEVFENHLSKKEAREQLGIPIEAKVFGFIGQIRPYKGVEELLIAYSKLIDQSKEDIYLIIAGKTGAPYSKNYFSDKAKFLKNLLVFPSFIKDNELQLYYNATDFVVAPYKSILTSGSVISALDFRRPVIAPNMGMIADIVSDGVNGFLYTPEKQETIFYGMQKALSTELDEKSFKKQTEEISKELDWNLIGKRFYKNVIEENTGPHTMSLKIGESQRQVFIVETEEKQISTSTLGIIILNYQNTDDTQKLIHSIKDSDHQDYKIIVVDNNSEPSSFLKEQLSHCDILQTKKNLGYAAGNNIGIAYAKSLGLTNYIITNPDTIFYANTLSRLVTESSSIKSPAIHSGLILRGNNQSNIQFAGAKLNEKSNGFVYPYEGLNINEFPDTPIETDYVNGAFMYFNENVLEQVGYIPEDYFLYYEETDWCLQAKQKGVNLLIHPSVKIIHNKRSEESNLPSIHYLYYYIRNTFYFKEKHLKFTNEKIEADLRRDFINPWLENINHRNSNYHKVADHLINYALEDGKNKVRNSIDIENVLNATPNYLLTQWKGQGCIDGVFDNKIMGWAIDPIKPWVSATITLWINGFPLGEFVANETRNDLKDLGVGNGKFGFSIPISSRFKNGQNHTITISFSSNNTPIDEAKTIFLPKGESNFEGFIENPDSYVIKGWAWDKSNPSTDIELDVFCDGELIDTTIANSYRIDLKKHGIKEGNSAFQAVLPAKFSKGGKKKFEIREKMSQNLIFSKVFNWTPRTEKQIFSGNSLEDLINWNFFQNNIYTNAGDNTFTRSKLLFESSKLALVSKYKFKPQTRLVSIVMPVFNRASIVHVAIESILQQSYENWEIIITDDGSEDDLLQRLNYAYPELLKSGKLKYFKFHINRGVSAARNLALKNCSGEYIAYLDSDNFWDKDYLLIMVNELINNPDFEAAYAGQLVTYTRKRKTETILEEVFIRISPYNSSLLENNNFIDLNIFFHSRALYEKLGGFNESMRRLVDWEFILKLTNKNKPKFIPAVLGTYCFGRIDNQITVVESFEDSHQKLYQSKNELNKNKSQEQIKIDNISYHLILICKPNIEKDLTNQLFALKNLATTSKVTIIYQGETETKEWVERIFSEIKNSTLVTIEKEKKDYELEVFNYFKEKILQNNSEHLVIFTDEIIINSGIIPDLYSALKKNEKIGIGLMKRLVKPSEPVHKSRKRISIGNFDFDLTLEMINGKILDPKINSTANIIEIKYIGNDCFFINKDLIQYLNLLSNNEEFDDIHGLMEIASNGMKTGLGYETVYLPDIMNHDYTYFE